MMHVVHLYNKLQMIWIELTNNVKMPTAKKPKRQQPKMMQNRHKKNNQFKYGETCMYVIYQNILSPSISTISLMSSKDS